MKAKFLFALSLTLCSFLLLANLSHSQNPVGEIAGHPLDKAFEKRADGSIVNGLLNDPLFAKAVEAAKKARDGAEKNAKIPGFVGPSPTRAARAAFLDVLNGGGEGGGVGAVKK